ncbi:MAG: aspartyl protease family protein [Chloroflexi bacterium]|nr:aspartyl protease family protein [Chloroflexota bacterium]
MGFVKTRVKISNPAEPSRTAELELLVDTGATFTMLPGSLLREIGVQADTSFRLRLADGRFLERGGCTVWMEVKGKGYKVPVVIGENGDVSVLGVTALEILGFEVDPMSRKLKPADYLAL